MSKAGGWLFGRRLSAIVSASTERRRAFFLCPDISENHLRPADTGATAGTPAPSSHAESRCMAFRAKTVRDSLGVSRAAAGLSGCCAQISAVITFARLDAGATAGPPAPEPACRKQVYGFS